MAGSADNDPVVLVDADDVEIGSAGKLEAHQRGLKHRAISVLVRNAKGPDLKVRIEKDGFIAVSRKVPLLRDETLDLTLERKPKAARPKRQVIDEPDQGDQDRAFGYHSSASVSGCGNRMVRGPGRAGPLTGAACDLWPGLG